MMLAVLRDRLYLAEAGSKWPLESDFHLFQTKDVLPYISYCDDFGPMNIASVVSFIEELHNELSSFPNQKIVYVADKGRRGVTNAAFMLGAYLILVLNESPCEVWNQFQGWYNFECYRDATFSEPDFGLTLLDCWRGLACGAALRWIGFKSDEVKFDMEEYQHYDSPINGELHVVVPDKFVAFRSPSTLHGDMDYEDSGACRRFSAKYYVDVFKEMGVTTVVRLNAPEYDKTIFEDAGIEHYDLEFEDCTAPSFDIAARFLRIVDRSHGMIAVHCHAGLGRTGTLIALYLMLAHNFGAREAIAWLRIVRPGSIIGEQQHYLCEVEHRLRKSACTGAHMGSGCDKTSAHDIGMGFEGSTGHSIPAAVASSLKRDKTLSVEQARQVSEAIRQRNLKLKCSAVQQSDPLAIPTRS